MRLVSMLLAMMLSVAAVSATQQTIVFVDGSRMAIQSYEIKGALVLITTAEGKLRSVPLAYVDMAQTRALAGGTTSPPTPAPAPAPESPPRPEPPAEPVPAPPAPEPEEPMPAEPEPATPESAPMPPEPAPAPEPVPPAPTPEPPEPPVLERAEVEPEPEIPVPAPPPPEPEPETMEAPAFAPPPSAPEVWSNDELRVSLQVPGGGWIVKEMPPSFDVAVTLENPGTEARATLALIRQRIRGRGDFRDVVGRIQSSITAASGYMSLGEGELAVEPYQAREFRFVKTVDFESVYNRLVVFYSRDLVYVLSLTCPESRVADNEQAFEELVRGLTIAKSRDQLTF